MKSTVICPVCGRKEERMLCGSRTVLCIQCGGDAVVADGK